MPLRNYLLHDRFLLIYFRGKNNVSVGKHLNDEVGLWILARSIRLAIARALIRDPRILLLDEATVISIDELR